MDFVPTQYITAHWVLPISTPPLLAGVVGINRSRISGIYEQKEFQQRFPDVPLQDYGEAILLPGLINLHTHLEYSHLHLKDNYLNLFDWMEALVGKTRSWPSGQWLASALSGARQMALSGTSCLADSAYNGLAVATALAEVGLRGIVGLELFGLDSLKHQDSS